jgi:hypothetical protein
MQSRPSVRANLRRTTNEARTKLLAPTDHTAEQSHFLVVATENSEGVESLAIYHGWP